VIRDGWTHTGEARLHCLIHEGEPRYTPLVYMPGSLGDADDFRTEMLRLAPRTTVAVSPRGLGKSSAPAEGYSFQHRVADLESMLTDIGPETFTLMAFSLGVPIALGYAARHPGSIKGLILLDYPARYPKRSDSWLHQALPFAQGRGIAEHVVQRLQSESQTIELWEELESLRSATLLITGGQSSAVRSDDLDRYTKMPHVQIVSFPESGHEVFRPDYERFMGVIERFLTGLDG
jgi:pimeloyl-ACP methyl ester carboxylesterase